VGEESDQLRREIEQTRRELGTDVDALSDKVSPRRVVERRVDRARDAVGGIKEKVMGSTSDVGSSAGTSVSGAASSVQDTVSGAASSVQSAASSVGDTAAATATKARRQAEGNPLAAGLIAFGVGWLVSSLLPASRQERELAHQVKDQAQPAVQAAGQQAGQALAEVKDNLRQPAQDAVQSVKDTATDAAGTVTGEARSAAGEVKDQAQDSTQQVREQTSSSR
jgi:gas vesicle protein